MKKTKFILLAFLMVLISFSSLNAKNKKHAADPVTIEVVTKHISISDALMAAKTALLKQKFILDGTMGEKTFTAKRTTGAKADYYVADVTASMDGGKTKLSISFVKVGTGLLKLKKVADAVKADLEK